MMIKAGGVWDPSYRRWLFRLDRLGRVLRAVRRRLGVDE
jgi:hypothetical protein